MQKSWKPRAELESFSSKDDKTGKRTDLRRVLSVCIYRQKHDLDSEEGRSIKEQLCLWQGGFHPARAVSKRLQAESPATPRGPSAVCTGATLVLHPGRCTFFMSLKSHGHTASAYRDVIHYTRWWRTQAWKSIQDLRGRGKGRRCYIPQTIGTREHHVSRWPRRCRQVLIISKMSGYHEWQPHLLKGKEKNINENITWLMFKGRQAPI